jgi:hypothetical protein
VRLTSGQGGSTRGVTLLTRTGIYGSEETNVNRKIISSSRITRLDAGTQLVSSVTESLPPISVMFRLGIFPKPPEKAG